MTARTLTLVFPRAPQRTRWRAGVAAAQLLVVLALAAEPWAAGAQVFLSTRPNPEFEIGPLFVRASVDPALGPVTVDVLWSVAVPPTRSALGLEQDLYLLWPAELRGEDRAATPRDARLDEYLRRRGFAMTGHGQLPLFVEDLYPPPGATASDRRIGAAPFVSFRHAGLESLGVQPTASIVRIAWTPELVNRTRLLKLRLVLDGAITRKRANWLEELVRAPRYVLTLSFNDVRNPAIFPLYLENRARAIDLASEPSQILARFADPQRLRIDDIYPRSASREPAEGGSSEVVSAFLDTSENAAPQILSVQFGYASRLQAWAPILIPLAFFVLGRATGPLIERVARGLGHRLSARLRFGRPAQPSARAEGAFLSRETLARIVPGRTTYDEVLALCGQDTLEEQQRLGAPEQRTLVYVGRRVVPRQERRLLWFLSSVSGWELEEQTVEITLERNVVQDVQVRVRRARLPHPDTA
jgi:hypothetical protein